jgi:hypothetical protein
MHLVLALFASTLIGGSATTTKLPSPSRPADQGCRWESINDTTLGLAAWVQQCKHGTSEIHFAVSPPSVTLVDSDVKGPPYAVIDVIDLEPGESAENGMRRVFEKNTDAKIAKRCVLKPYTGDKRPGVQRFAFVPDAAYAKELDAVASSDEVGDPPCGDWGDAPDGIQYFEVQPKSGAHKVLFVRVGQDIPLFDERTLTLLPWK